MTPVAPARVTQLPRLTSLRAVAALFVFVYHVQFLGIWARGRVPFDLGYTGVAFFFILSGFVLTWSAAPTDNPGGFWWRRFARVYPAYAFVLAVSALIGTPGTPPRSAPGTISAFFLMQSWVPRNLSFAYAVNPPSWSLSDEAFFYLALPLLLPLLSKIAPKRRLAATAAWFGLTAAVLAYAAHQGHSWRYIALFPLVRSGEFLVGVTAALELKRGRRLSPRLALTAVLASLALTAALPRAIPLPEVLLDPMWLAIIVWAAQADVEGRRGWLLTRRWAVYAGGASFAFYLVHFDVVSELARHAGHGPRVAALALITAAATAAAVHHGVERPLRRWLLSARVPRRAATRLVPALPPGEEPGGRIRSGR